MIAMIVSIVVFILAVIVYWIKSRELASLPTFEDLKMLEEAKKNSSSKSDESI